MYVYGTFNSTRRQILVEVTMQDRAFELEQHRSDHGCLLVMIPAGQCLAPKPGDVLGIYQDPNGGEFAVARKCSYPNGGEFAVARKCS